MAEYILKSLKAANQLIEDFVQQPHNINLVDSIVNRLANCFKSGNKVIVCGNGGSMCDAMHFAEEFTGKFCKNRKALPAICLSDPGYLTCVANDFGYDQVFARGVSAYANPGDCLVLLTTSGNSDNIIAAASQANQMDVHTIAFIGRDGGKLKDMCHHQIIAASGDSARIQELHMCLLHIIIEGVELSLFPDIL